MDMDIAETSNLISKQVEVQDILPNWYRDDCLYDIPFNSASLGPYVIKAYLDKQGILRSGYCVRKDLQEKVRVFNLDEEIFSIYLYPYRIDLHLKKGKITTAEAVVSNPLAHSPFHVNNKNADGSSRFRPMDLNREQDTQYLCRTLVSIIKEIIENKQQQ